MKIIISILLAVTITYLYNQYITRDIYHGPDSNILKKKIFKDNNTCFKYKPIPHICPLRKT
jgi:hypothetical protein